jgi:selenocysteine-specific elongation factor
MAERSSDATIPSRDRPPLTLGTAGHIDHGKTALITRLTGKNTDRLREERERGISIELGYAELELPSGARLSVVDVPGHERFVRTMVAGATGVDIFLLVIAADDGVMPQTMEHLSIIELLGVRDGVVALTKADLVDEELLELAEDDVRALLGETPFAECEVVTVSARDGRGLDDLLAALERVARRTKADRRAGPARLPVDRVFPLKGIGTVVTGTLWTGELKAGDGLVVVPGGARAGVRSVQVHDHDAEVVHAGSRVGVNLRGLGRDDIARGDWLAAPALAALAGRRFDAWISVLPGARALRSGDQVRVHHGTAQYLARVAPLEGREIAPGASAAAVVRMDADALALPHDRFIVRSLSPVATVAGGEVLLAGAQRWHGREQHARFLAAVRAGDTRAAVSALAQDRGERGLTPDDLAAAGFAPSKTAKALAAAVAAGELEELAPARGAGAVRWFGRGVTAALRAALLAGATERTAARPERPFSSAVELAALVPALSAPDAGLVLQTMVEAGDLVAGEGGYAPAGAGVLGDQQAELAEQVLVRLAADRLAPPTLAVLAEELRRPPRELAQLLDVLARRGDVVRVDKDLWFTSTAVDGAREVLLAQLESAGEVTIAGFRDAAGCGRRNAQALLEYFDREGLTLRRGDVRVARRRRS